MICSIMAASAMTSMVMRETVGSSVVPTARDSMLYPLREKRRDTWERTPAAFSTRTDSVWRVMSVCAFILSTLLNPTENR